jgi:AcrR family transcriptional regulator
MTRTSRPDPTKERILDEAETLFAEKGYHAVSVREITGRAGCNLSAVNYHFGNKEKLYLSVFRDRWLPRAFRIRDAIMEAVPGGGPPSPRALIEALARAFLAGPLTDEERQRHHQLMFGELNKPGEAFDLVAEEVMRPFVGELMNIIRPSMPEGLRPERLMLNMLCVFSMVLYFSFAQPAVTRLTGKEYDSAFKERLVAHIVSFSLNGLGLGEEGA